MPLQHKNKDTPRPAIQYIGYFKTAVMKYLCKYSSIDININAYYSLLMFISPRALCAPLSHYI